MREINIESQWCFNKPGYKHLLKVIRGGFQEESAQPYVSQRVQREYRNRTRIRESTLSHNSLYEGSHSQHSSGGQD